MRMTFSKHRISARWVDNQSMPTMTSKLPRCIGMRSIEKVCSSRFSTQLRIIELIEIDFPLATSTTKGSSRLVWGKLSKGSNFSDTNDLSAPESNNMDA